MSEKRARADRRARRKRCVMLEGADRWVSTMGGDVPLYTIRGASTSHAPVFVVTPRY